MDAKIRIGRKSKVESVAFVYRERQPLRHVEFTDADGGEVWIKFDTAEDAQRLLDALTVLRDGMREDLAVEHRGVGQEVTAFPVCEAVPA